MTARRLQHIPTMREIEAAELAAIAAFKRLHGEDHSPSAWEIREAALRMLERGE